MRKYIYALEGLDCAHCAGLIENNINELEWVDSASINFINKSLTLTLKENSAETVTVGGMEQALREIINRLEPDVVLKAADKNTADHHHEHDHGNDSRPLKATVIRIAASVILLAGAIIGENMSWVLPLTLAMFMLSYLVIGYDILLRSAKNIARGSVFDENFLMTVATVGAFAIGEYPEAVAVMLFYQIGRIFQSHAIGKSRRSIAALMDIRPEFANLKNGSDFSRIPASEVRIGDILLVKPGERIPVDAIVLEGTSLTDCSALTGESVPVEVLPQSAVSGGVINLSSPIVIEAQKLLEESAVSKILDLVENSATKKSRTENFISRFARVYTPIVVLAALLLSIVPPLITGDPFSAWLYRGLVFLVVSCPCALVISIPLGFFGGIGSSSKKGILVKGGNYLEALAHTGTVVFDKTGTLTKGSFDVKKIVPHNTSAEELLRLAAYGGCYSSHPVTAPIREAYKQANQPELDIAKISGYEEIAGQGIRAVFDGKRVLTGNKKLLEGFGISFPAATDAGTAVHVALNEEYLGYILIADEIKPDAANTVAALAETKIKTVMLTGDNEAAAAHTAKELGITDYKSGLLPQDKLDELEVILSGQNNKRVIFVGDGINDSPVLARADVGIAMGGLGSDAAIEAADVVIMNDEPSKIPLAISIAKQTMRIVKQNIIFALGIKGLVLLLSTLGYANMWQAVFADVGVALLAILNSVRLLMKE